MIDSKDYFAAREPKATPRVEVLAADLDECRRWIRVLYRLRHLDKEAVTFQIEEAYKVIERQQRIKPTL